VISLERYRELFEVPQLKATLLASVVGRMPIGITGLAILLFVQGRSGSFALAGAASAMYVLGLALIAPLLGRLIDRIGPRPVLSVCGVLYPAALSVLTLIVLRTPDPLGVGVMALVAGATLPPISACIRALYPRLLPVPGLLHTAYSVDSAVVEAVFILGPALVAACVAAGYPEAAVLLAAFSAAAGTAIFVRTPAVRAWSGVRRGAVKSWLGALRHRRLVVLFATTLLYALAFGLFEVAVIAHASGKNAPAAAGVALALTSLGSGAGALVYGAHRWRAPMKRQFTTALLLMAGGMLLLVPVDHLTWYALTCIIAGIPMATVIATQSLLVSHLSPRDQLAESFTWSTTCLLAGISGGIAAGGVLAERYAPYWLLVCAVIVTMCAVVVTALALHAEPAEETRLRV
jgi:MFS family permease